MAIYDPVLAGSPQFQGHSDVRYDRGLRISWGGIIAGTVLGWAVFSLLSLLGAAIGLAKFDPYSADPANGLGAGSGVFGVIALLVSSFLGAYLAVRIAGDRRRSEALLHGATLLGVLADDRRDARMGAARTAAQSAATRRLGPRAQARAERETNVRRNSALPKRIRDRAAEASDTAGEDHRRRGRRRIPRARRLDDRSACPLHAQEQQERFGRDAEAQAGRLA